MNHIDCYLAHSGTPEHPEGQLLKEHLEHVSSLAETFCQHFGAEEDGRSCGLYHDIGKYSDAFQRRLRGSAEPVDHSSAGALLMYEQQNIPASMCIAGHHAGLSDAGNRNDLTGTYMARISQAKAGALEDYSAYRQEIAPASKRGNRQFPGIGNYFYIKMLFSALTDADWLDTEAFFRDRPYSPPSANLVLLRERLENRLASFGPPKNDLNARRARILEAARQHGADTPGLFSMTVPTGGGKTLSSMAFALHHALCHGLRRIIYVIPYCSILEQTQAIFEDIFGQENITAHYSGAEFERPENGNDTRAFSAENWEAPIILTTAVQFFESLFSNKPGKNRKLHNISDSVIIFDEAQMLPISFLKPCLAAICQLSENYGCSAVLCTATQPAVEPLIQKLAPQLPVRELCPEPEEMYQAFRRVSYVDEGELSDDALVAQLSEKSQVLCVVNSRKQAQKLYQCLEGDGNYHLSTMMIPQDRKRVLRAIRERLKAGKACRVISTSLVEAGVDLDFPEVYRALAGLDSIIQAGGRCNREGKRLPEESLVHIFRSEAKPPQMLEQNISAARRTLRNHTQVDSPEAVHNYFSFLLYTLRGEERLDEKNILPDAEKLRFQTVSRAFHLIDGADYTVYVPIDEGADLIRRLRREGLSRSLLRALGQFSVGVYRQYFERLRDAGALELVSDNAGILADLNLYSRETGLPFEISEQNQGIFI